MEDTERNQKVVERIHSIVERLKGRVIVGVFHCTCPALLPHATSTSGRVVTSTQYPAEQRKRGRASETNDTCSDSKECFGLSEGME